MRGGATNKFINLSGKKPIYILLIDTSVMIPETKNYFALGGELINYLT